jgi:uncharacterized membrane protein
MTEKKLFPIRIVSSGGAIGTQVFIGDYAVPYLIDVTFEHKVNGLPVVRLDLLAVDGVEIEGESTVDAFVRRLTAEDQG